jgi:hypothetical protein
VRIRSLSLTLVMIAACGGPDEPHGLSPAEVRLDRTYRLQDCITQASSTPEGCVGWVSVHWGEVIDSSRLVLSGQNQAAWTVWLTTNANPCYLGDPPCPSSTTRVKVMLGSYGVTAAGIMANVGGYSVLFAAEIPARVDPSWTGPDTLSAENPLVNPNLSSQKMRFR